MRVTIDEAGRIVVSKPVRDALPLSEAVQQSLHRRLRDAGVFGGAVYDGIIALTAIEHDATLLSRDARAWRIYAALGATVASPGF